MSLDGRRRSRNDGSIDETTTTKTLGAFHDRRSAWGGRGNYRWTIRWSCTHDPGGLGLLAGWIFAKTVPARNKPIVPASAVLAGHGLWMLIGMILLSLYDVALIDFLILVGGAIWL